LSVQHRHASLVRYAMAGITRFAVRHRRRRTRHRRPVATPRPHVAAPRVILVDTDVLIAPLRGSPRRGRVWGPRAGAPDNRGKVTPDAPTATCAGLYQAFAQVGAERLIQIRDTLDENAAHACQVAAAHMSDDDVVNAFVAGMAEPPL
jgi:hypothetical protein